MKRSGERKVNQPDNTLLYELPEHWDGHQVLNVDYVSRCRVTQALIPHDCASLLDVGCGDGVLTNYLLGNGRTVIGVDRSAEALRKCRFPTVRASAEHLPFQDGSMDLVTCCEVLEHLPEDLFSRAVSEISRVASRFIIVSVPLNEQLIANTTLCATCGRKYHVWGHVRAFRTIDDIATLFSKWEIRTACGVGRQRRYSWARLRIPMIRWALGNWPSESALICPYCGSRAVEQQTSPNLVLRELGRKLAWRLPHRDVLAFPWCVIVVLVPRKKPL